MKAYRITDDFKIVRHGNRLRFEIGNQVVDDINDDDVSNILKQVLEIHENRATCGWIKEGADWKIILRMSVEYNGGGEWSSVNFIAGNDMVMLKSDILLLKLFNVLSFILPKLCEEGIV